MSMGILYTSFTLFSVAASPVVTWLGSKRALVVGTSGYVLFILANLVPTWCVRPYARLRLRIPWFWVLTPSPTDPMVLIFDMVRMVSLVPNWACWFGCLTPV